ncbi:DUF4856 domain-containing protein [Maribacter sp. SA7]|uniref:DUF4856 domain-containing protein n=1 Tax=Maribacter zhoushanensis TaxID=3030012 RepID=UPI0023EC7BE5|nr:DUF4856 domain-containing protein [Maribacter zhoushanensis]MDF4202394.1 DUF4856 domain-containing protein [Maribacter zhoushanensis]
MNKFFLAIIAVAGLAFTSCSSEDDSLELSPCDNCFVDFEVPDSYVFTRNGASTVSFDGQTTRIKMGQELLSNFNIQTKTFDELNGMFAHIEGEVDFEETALNESDKSLRSKVAASADYFSTNATDQAIIRADLEGFISAQVADVYPNWEVAAAAGQAGQLADGESTRYVNANGLEYNQLFAKSLIGSLMTDQILNNYLSTAVLDEADNVANNDADVVEEGKDYTTMEHKWDEAYGYAYGLNADQANPNADLGADSFLNEYIERANADSDFEGIADDIFEAYKLGRAAIVAKDYDVRNAQAEIIKENISKVIAIRAIYYLQNGKTKLEGETPNVGGAFHALSEAYGFIYSLQFTRQPNSSEPYFSKEEVDAFLTQLLADGENGLWNVEAATLDAISEDIAAQFDFTVAEAAE